MSYRNTLQADALKLVAKKLQSSLAVEGELPEDGLAAYGDDGDDLMMALARKIVSGEEEEDAETMEKVFAQARDAEATAEEYLVDDDWRAVEIEPEAVAVNGNGLHADGIGPTVELVLDTGHHANGNGHAAVEVNGKQLVEPVFGIIKEQQMARRFLLRGLVNVARYPQKVCKQSGGAPSV